MLVLHMILYHISQWAEVNYVLEQVLFFFMPWFFFKAGMFHKVKDEKVLVRDSARRLLVPFIVFSAIGEVVIWLRLAVAHDHVVRHYLSFPKELLMAGSIQGNLVLWFLLSLFICRILFNYLSLIRIKPLIITGAFAVSAIGLNYMSTAVFVPYYFGNVCYGMVFYSAGYIMRSVKIPLTWLICLGAVILACGYFCPALINARINDAAEGEYLLTIPYNLAGILFINNIVRFIPARFLKYTALHHIGEDSMSYYVSHWIIILLCDLVCVNIFNIGPGWHYYWIMVSACILTLPFINTILNRRFGRYIGNKK